MLKFFRENGRLTNNYSEVDEVALPIIAKINPHFRLDKEAYFDLDDQEFLLLVEEFEEHNRRVKQELRNSQQGARRR